MTSHINGVVFLRVLAGCQKRSLSVCLSAMYLKKTTKKMSRRIFVHLDLLLILMTEEKTQWKKDFRTNIRTDAFFFTHRGGEGGAQLGERICGGRI